MAGVTGVVYRVSREDRTKCLPANVLWTWRFARETNLAPRLTLISLISVGSERGPHADPSSLDPNAGAAQTFGDATAC